MIITDGEAELAYTYAWWLTGDAQSARSAVLSAIGRADVPGADEGLRVEILLRRVRAAAIQTPTMCPASELALLHDGIGLPLAAAADLALIDTREARTELAHGRLEALGQDDGVDIVEPERLGGLAVGNPADVAAARQNPKLAELRRRILQGRDELVTVSRVTLPDDLAAEVARRREAAPEGVRTALLSSSMAGTAPATAAVAPVEDESGAGSGAESGADLDTEAGADADIDTSADLDTGSGSDLDGDLDIDTGSTDDGSAAVDAGDADPFAGIPSELPPALARSADADSARSVTSIRRRDRDDDPDGMLDDVDTEEVDLSAHVGDVQPSLGRPGRSSATIVWVVVGIAAVVAVAVLLTNIGDGTLPEDGAAAIDQTLLVPTATEAPSDVVVGPVGPDADPTGPATPEPGGSEDVEGFVLTGSGAAVGLGADPQSDNPTATPFDPVSFSVGYRGAQGGDAIIVDWTVDGARFDQERVDLLPGESVSRFTKPFPDEGWPVGQHVLVLRLAGVADPIGEIRFTVVPESPSQEAIQ